MKTQEQEYRGTLFQQLLRAIYAVESGDENAIDQKQTLMMICETKFGEEATRQAVETASKFYRYVLV